MKKSIDSSGVITPFFVVFSVVLFLSIAFLIDGGRYLSLQISLRSEAEQAAEIGSMQMSQSSLYRSTPEVNPVAAIQAASNYLSGQKLTYKIWVRDNVVYVSLTKQEPTLMLSLIGIDKLTANVTESASDLVGISQGKEI